MPNLARALLRILSAACQVSNVPTESEAVNFARQHLAQTSRAVADANTPEDQAPIGQIMAFFGLLNGMFLNASKTWPVSALERELFKCANAGLMLDSDPATV